MNTNEFTVTGVSGVSDVRAGDDVSAAFKAALSQTRLRNLQNGDVVVVASKVVSISENRLVKLDTVEVSNEAQQLSKQTGKDARIVELILQESVKHRLATAKGPIIALHRLGLELTSAGVDAAGDGGAYLLPENPDRSAQTLAEQLRQIFELDHVGVIIADSDGRPYRAGATVIAIGSFGFEPLRRTQSLVDGRTKDQEETIVDMMAAAAGIVIGQRGRGVPFAVIRGVGLEPSQNVLRSILVI
jgi:coenzyme F420-0:L-glutamate ligase/coenzyme F420-1:gamma-L-glutamate ligase